MRKGEITLTRFTTSQREWFERLYTIQAPAETPPSTPAIPSVRSPTEQRERGAEGRNNVEARSVIFDVRRARLALLSLTGRHQFQRRFAAVSPHLRLLSTASRVPLSHTNLMGRRRAALSVSMASLVGLFEFELANFHSLPESLVKKPCIAELQLPVRRGEEREESRRSYHTQEMFS